MLVSPNQRRNIAGNGTCSVVVGQVDSYSIVSPCSEFVSAVHFGSEVSTPELTIVATIRTELSQISSESILLKPRGINSSSSGCSYVGI